MQVYVFFSILEFTKDAITSTQPTFYLDISVSIRDLHQKKLVQRSSLILLLVLATTVMRRGKRSVVHVTQCIAALVLVQGSASLFEYVLPHRSRTENWTKVLHGSEAVHIRKQG